MNILIADDELNTRDALAEVLRDEGHSVTAVAGGRLAIEHLGRAAVDLVITDLNMPDVDGVEVVELARRMQPNAAVVVITAYGDRFRHCYPTNGDVVLLTKPFRLNEILDVVADIAAGARESQVVMASSGSRVGEPSSAGPNEVGKNGIGPNETGVDNFDRHSV